MIMVIRLLAEPSPIPDGNLGPAHVVVPPGLAVTFIICGVIFVAAWLYDHRKKGG